MKNNNLLQTNNLNTYFYSERYKCFSYFPEGFVYTESISKEDCFYYVRKYEFLHQKRYFETPQIELETRYEPEKILSNIGNLRQLLIEVTDCCNLQCAYCGYGEYYNNYDKRETRQQQFSTVKAVIDQFATIWDSELNTSHNKVIHIGFYGGEPLMNFPLIKKVINYVEQLNIPGITFGYNMTTNGVLLHRCMDFIAEKNFSLLISLDGDEFNSSYRVDKKGNNLFQKIVNNVHLLKEKYPDYFEESVNFNSVLHDRNSVTDTYQFIKEQFGKTPRVAQLNLNGVDEEKQEEFMQMFNGRPESVRKAELNKQIFEDEDFMDSDTTLFHSFIQNHTDHNYTSFSDLYYPGKRNVYIPTGTCQPFERKLFLTVNGKLLPCEKIGHQHVLGVVEDGKLELDYERIADYYSELYSQVVKFCRNCMSATACGQCVFNLIQKDGKVACPYFIPKNKKSTYLVEFLGYAEDNPEKYAEIMDKMIID